MSSKQFLQQVTSYIRSKEARCYVETELQHHLEEAKRAWLQKGYTEKEAEQKAMVEMGSASRLGKAMNQIHRPKWDIWLIGAVILLLIASFIPVITTDFTIQFGEGMAHYFFQHKLLQVVLALGVMVSMIYIDYRRLQRFSFVIYSVAILLLLVMPTMFVNGQAVLKVGPFNVQVWLLLPLLLVAFASFFADTKWKLWQLLLLALVPLYLFLTLPNLPVALLYSILLIVLFSFSVYSRKVKMVVLSTVAVSMMAVGGVLLYAYKHVAASYQVVRLHAFLEPTLYAETEGYVLLQLKAALEGAGWFGGANTTYIPEAHTDYAFVQLIQAYGYSAGIAIVLVMLVIMWRMLQLVRTMPTSFGKLLVLAAVTLYSAQTIYSLLMVLGWLPLTSMSLPFISYGMTSMLLHAIFIGLALSVYRRKSYVTQPTFTAS